MEPYKDECKKPPLGLLPKYIHDDRRLDEVSKAIKRYANELFPLKTEWIEEYNELINRRNGK